MKRALPIALVLCFACTSLKPRRDVSADAGSLTGAGPSAPNAALCAYLARCVPKAMRAFSRGSVESCVAYYSCGSQGLAALGLPPLRDEDACAAEIKASPCGALSLGSSGTAPRLAPKPGSACFAETAAAPAGRANVGERCFSGERSVCAAGLYCKLEVPLRARGDSLCGMCSEPTPLGEDCSETQRCDDGAYCHGDRCVPRLPEGEACEHSGDCQSDLICQAGACVPNPYLHLVASGESTGEACSPGSNCAGDVTLACVQGRCKPRADQGEACAGVGACRAGLLCGADNTCSAPRQCTEREGAVCGQEIGCSAPLVCVGDGEKQHCSAPVIGHAAGEACNAGCDGDLLTCANGRCTPHASTLGARCSTSFDCTGSVCNRDIAPYCQLNGNSYQCSVPPCAGCGTCVEKPSPAACDPR